VAHAMSSETLHRVARPRRMGWGATPFATKLSQCLVETATIRAALAELTNSLGSPDSRGIQFCDDVRDSLAMLMVFTPIARA
jgi:hypothetical protein